MRNLFLLITAGFLFFSLNTEAQYYNTGQDPGSLKWMQIKTDRFRIIYPESFGQRGQDFARALEEAAFKLKALYPDLKYRLPVIIHNYTTMSNGYVAWAPSRMEIYPTPEQNTIPLDPYKQLAIHELTHVLQMESLNKGFTKAMSYIAGQQFPGAVAALTPLWFLEGDAVFSESALTNSGRGRTPDFQKQLKAILVEKGKIYSYDKILNGSYRDFVPDHYRTGYQMVAWSYTRYDSTLWKKALKLTANIPFSINPVNFSLRNSASLTKKRLFRETFDTLKSIWTKDDSASGSINYDILNPEKKERYINYYSPVHAGKDSIIAVRTSLSRPPAIVIINPSSGTENILCTPGYLYPWTISCGKGKVVWVETRTDPRWENRTWSVIQALDLKNGRITQFSKKSRFMAAAISHDGRYIAAVSNTVKNTNELVIIDAATGRITSEISPPRNAYLQKPQWDDFGRKIILISLTDEGEGILSYDVEEKTWETLIEESNNDLQSAYLRNDSLFFVSSFSGTDNIYLRDDKGSISCLTRSRFGTGDLNVTGNKIIFTDYSASGNNICQTKIEKGSIDFKTIDNSSSFLINRFRSNAKLKESVDYKVYYPEPYRKWKHLFRFHSWMPFYADIDKIQDDPASITPGFTLMSQNNLSTLISTFGYEYSEERHKFHTSIRWLGWYPELETRIDYGESPLIEKPDESIPDPSDHRQGLAISNSIYLPLRFQSGSFSQFLQISGLDKFTNDHIYIKELGYYDEGQNQITGRFYFTNYFRSAERDIHPRWAQVLDLSYTSYPFDRKLYGYMITARTAFYFPGLLRNNSFRLRFEAEKQNPEKYLLKNKTNFSRGYDEIISKKIGFISADYFMPLVYPDFNISSLFYLKRIRGDIFYDYTKGTGNFTRQIDEDRITWSYNDGSETFKSFGVQLLSDFYLFRIPYMISAGIEATWYDLRNFAQIKLLFNMDIYGMNIGRERFRYWRF